MLGENLRESLAFFESRYKKYKVLRTLIFRQNLGCVDLSLEFENGVFKFSVTPLQATIIQLFNSEEPVTLSHSQIAELLSSNDPLETMEIEEKEI